MHFSNMRSWLVGGALVVASIGVSHAQDNQTGDFDSRYAELSAAMLNKDSAKLGQLLTPEFETTDLKGKIAGKAEVLARLEDRPGDETFKPAMKVLSVRLAGDSASVESQMSADVKQTDPDGAEITFNVAVVAEDTWIKRAGTWLMQKSVQKELIVSHEGQVVHRQGR